MEMKAKEAQEMTQENTARKPYEPKRYLLVFFLLSTTVLLMLIAAVAVLYVKQDHEYKTMRKTLRQIKEDGRERINKVTPESRILIEKKLNETQHILRAYIDRQMKSFTVDEMRRLREKTGPLPNSSLQSIQDDVTSLNSTVDKMRRYLARQSNSSDVRMHHLLSVLKQATRDLRLVKSELTQLNISLRSDLNWTRNSLFSSMENLRTELKTLNNSITLAMNTFRDELNSTKQDIVHIFYMLSHHNSSFHSKVQDASDALLMEVKDVGQKLVSIQNSTTRELQQLRRESNHTAESLRDAHNKIVQSNRSLHTVLERIATSMRSSIRNVNVNIVNLRKDIESNKRDTATQYKNINEELSKTKIKFQELERKLNFATSGIETKMKNNQASQENVQRSQQTEISKLQDEVEALRKDMKNKASSSLHMKECVNMPFVVAFSFIIKFILN